MTGRDQYSKADALLEAAARAADLQEERLRKVLADARQLRERGPGSMYAQDEARHMAVLVLDLLIEALEALAPEPAPTKPSEAP